MASLTQDARGRSPFWVCCYTNGEGRRLKKTTKVTVKPLPGEKREDGKPKTAADKRTEALEFCLAIERAENTAKAGTLTEQAAKKIIGEIVERTSGQKLRDYTVEGWFGEWCALKADTKSKATVERYGQVKREFLATLGGKAKLSIAHITIADVRAYRAAELEAGKSPKTANLSVKIVSSAFNAAKNEDIISYNPCMALEPLPEETAERSTFTPEQVAQLIENAEGDWKGAILLAYYTGARLRDVANMQWKAIDTKNRAIIFTPRKTKNTKSKKKNITVPLHADLERELMKAPGIGKAFLFPSLAGRPTGGKTGLSGQFGAIMERAEIKGEITRHTENGRANNSLSFHSLRHSFNSAMANAGVNQEIRKKLTGHASAAMNDDYTHLELEPLRAAVDVIPSVKAKGTK